jgi:hypothetical protein
VWRLRHLTVASAYPHDQDGPACRTRTRHVRHGPGDNVPAVRSTRCCSRNGCDQPAVATLTYIYADSTAVVGPLAGQPEPHTYDLCQGHAYGLTAPRGWVLVRHDGDLSPPPPVDDLLAVADAVREGPPVPGGGITAAADGGPPPTGRPRPSPTGRRRPSPGPAARRGHLRGLPPT